MCLCVCVLAQLTILDPLSVRIGAKLTIFCVETGKKECFRDCMCLCLCVGQHVLTYITAFTQGYDEACSRYVSPTTSGLISRLVTSTQQGRFFVGPRIPERKEVKTDLSYLTKVWLEGKPKLTPGLKCDETPYITKHNIAVKMLPKITWQRAGFFVHHSVNILHFDNSKYF